MNSSTEHVLYETGGKLNDKKLRLASVMWVWNRGNKFMYLFIRALLYNQVAFLSRLKEM